MATCRWCTPQVGALICSGHGPCQDLIEAYATGRLGITQTKAANQDLLYCSNCVNAYHHARRDVVARYNHFGKLLSQKECYRLSTALTQTLRSSNIDDEVILLEKGQEYRMDGDIGLEEALRIPIMEILQYPFLLLHVDVAARLVEALIHLDTLNRSFHLDPYTRPPGLYLLLVNPQKQVQRWALRTARPLGRVSCNEYYNLKDLFHAIINANSHDMSCNDNVGAFEGFVTELPLHLFSHQDLKNFWLGVCMLLAILDEQAMEALLFDQVPPKNILQDILSAMEMTTEDESLNPFWPALQCLMVVLDRLGAKLWEGRNLDPMQVFQRVLNSPSYEREVEMALTVRIKHEADSAATCSESPRSVDATIAEGFNCLTSPLYQATLIQQWPRDFQRSIEADILEELPTIIQILQSDEARTLCTHHSAFLWFFPFIHSLMTMDTYAIGYVSEVIHHLVMRAAHSPLHLLVLSSVVVLHRSQNSLQPLWCSSASWIPTVIDGACGLVIAPLDPRMPSDVESLVLPYPKTQATEAARRCSLRLLCSLLRDGVIAQLSSDCQRFLDLLNLYARRHGSCSVDTAVKEGMCVTLKLLPEDRRILQTCISTIVFDCKWRADMHFNDQGIALRSTPARASFISTPNCDSPGLDGKEMVRASFCSNTFPLNHMQNVQQTHGSDLNDKRLKVVGFPDNCLGRNQNESQIHCSVGTTRTAQIGKNIFPFKREALWTDSMEEDESMETDASEGSGALAIASSDDDDDVIFICCSNPDGTENEIDAGGSTTNSNTLQMQTEPRSQCLKYVEKNMSECKEAFLRKDDACCSLFEGNKPTGTTMGTNVVKKTEYRKVKRMKSEDAISGRSKTEHKISCDDQIGKQKILKDGDGNKENQVDILDLVNGMKKVSHPQEFPVESIFGEGEALPPLPILSAKQTSTVTSSVSSVRDGIVNTLIDNDNCLYNASCNRDCAANETMLLPALSSRTTVCNALSHNSFSTSKCISDSCTSPGTPVSDKQLMTHTHDPSLASITCAERQFNFPKGKKRRASSPKKSKILTKRLRQILTPLARTTAEKFRSQTKLAALGSLSQKTMDCVKLCQQEAATNTVVTSKETASMQDNLHKSQEVQLAEAPLMTNLVGEPSGHCGQIASTLKAGVTTLEKKKASEVLPQASGSDVIGLQQVLVEKQSNDVDIDLHMQGLTPSGSQSTQAQTATMCHKSDLSRSTQSNDVDVDLHMQQGLTPSGSQSTQAQTATMCHKSDLSHSAQSNDIDVDLHMQGLTPSGSQSTQAQTTTMCHKSDLSRSAQSNDVDVDLHMQGLTPSGSQSAQAQTATMCHKSDLSRSAQSNDVDVDLHMQELTPSGSQSTQAQTATMCHKSDLSCSAQSNDVDVDLHMQGLTPSESQSTQAQTATMCHKSDFSRSSLLLCKASHLPSKDCRDTPIMRSMLKPGVEHAMAMESHLEKSALSFPAYERIGALPEKRDPHCFLTEILGWDVAKLRSGTCECEKMDKAEIVKLPLKYDSCHQYFNKMKPLLLIETWGKVVESFAQKRSGCRYSKLKLKSCSSSQNIFYGELEGQVEDRESVRPLHPVEGDLVLIWLSSEELNGGGSPSCNQSTQFNHHLAYVRKFSWMGTRNYDNTRFSLASLCVQTCLNLSSFVTKTLCCELVCSLVSEVRHAKALHLCSYSSLFRIMLSPKIEDFQPPPSGKELSPPFSLLEQYNESQSRAIVSAVTMIIPQPRVPKVFMLQGPPGTGKSRMIIGLVRTLLTDVSGALEGSTWRPGVSDRRDETLLRRVLICAPSHTALDDLLLKIIVTFKDHVKDVKNPKGNCGDINIVRLGTHKSISKKVALFSLQSLIEHRKAINFKHLQNLHGQYSLVKKEIEAFKQFQASVQSLSEIEEERKRKLLKKRDRLIHEINEQKRLELHKIVISGAHIICCSLNASDSFQLKDILRSGFGCIIVDEAAQSTEINSLVPLLNKCCKMVLVGDPEQLQPSVLSKRAQDLGYGRSLFERLLLCLQEDPNWSPIYLNVQCRMHHAICSFPSAHFYNNMLLTDLVLEHSRSQFAGAPYIVFDVKDSKEQSDENNENSLKNPVEAQLAIYIAEYLLQHGVRSVAVITPYSGQSACIMRVLKNSSCGRVVSNCRIEVDGVYGFQGREKDAVILSCVHASGEGYSADIGLDPYALDENQLKHAGFLYNKHQLNTALTRAKMSLIILGHLNTLMKFPLWNALIKDAHQRKVIVSTTKATMSRNIKMIFQERSANGKSFGEGIHRGKAVMCEKAPPLSVTRQEDANISQNLSPPEQPHTNKNGIKSVAERGVLTHVTNEKSFNAVIPSITRPYGDSFLTNLPQRRNEGLTVTISNN